MILLFLISLVSGIEELSFSTPTVKYFKVEFEVGTITIDKNYFTVQANTDNSSFTYFCRKERQYELTLINNETYKIYTTPVIDDSINSMHMILVMNQEVVDTLHVYDYLFISSILSFTNLSVNKTTVDISLLGCKMSSTIMVPTNKNTTLVAPLPLCLCGETSNYYYLIIPFVICILGSRYDLFLKYYRNQYGRPISVGVEESEETAV